MAFFNSAITVLQTLVVALGAGLGIWSVSGEPSTCWKVTATTIPARMLVYDKEAINKTIGRKPRYSVINQA